MPTHKGTATFIAQRASAVALIPLVIWFLVGAVGLAGADYAAARAFAAEPVNAIALAAFIALSAYHMRIGVAEVIADYIHGGLKSVLSGVNWAFAIAVAIAGIWSAWALAFAGR
jgi:succinate dehydrogenase / fumarate reductase membrane anchor subunit